MLFVIPEIPPSNNKFAGRKNVWEYRKTKQEWAEKVDVAVKFTGVEGVKLPYPKAKITITYYFKDKIRRDPDNFAGKFLLDGLKRSGVILDDSFENIVLVLKAGYDKKKARTEIEVLEVC